MNKKDIEAIFPLSHQQKGMFLETLLSPGSGIHIEQSVWGFEGALDVELFKRAWQSAMARHAMLRTAFVWKDRAEPLQVALRSAEIPIEQCDIRTLSPAEQKARIEKSLHDEGRKGFDLTRAPLMRLALFQTGEADYQIAWTSHHILMDGWCRQMVLQEVIVNYQALCKGQKIQLQPGLPYQGYIAWLKQQDMVQAEAFWRQELQGLAGPTLPGNPTEDSSVVEIEEPYETQSVCLSTTTTQALVALSQKKHVTLNTLLQGMWALLLSRYSGATDVIFGTTVSGRPADLPGSETIVGLFITTLPFRVRVAPDMSLWPWLQEIQAQHLHLRSYEYCSEGQIHPWSGMSGGQPLFESILVFENYPSGFTSSGASIISAASNAAPATASNVNMRFEKYVGARTKYALTLLAIPGAELELQLIGDRRRFANDLIPNILDHCVTLLQGLLGGEETSLSALLDKIPLGQVPSLRVRSAGQSKDDANFEAPQTQTEKALANVFAKLLNVEQMSRDDNFFSVGGHSLMALQLVNRVQETFHIDLPLQASFEAPTIAELARRIEQAQDAAREAALPAIERLPKEQAKPLSITQQAIWDILASPHDEPGADSPAPGFLRNLFGGRKPAANDNNPWRSIQPLVVVLRLDGTLDRQALATGLERLRQRHEALRTCFIPQGEQVLQDVCENAVDFRDAVSLRVVALPGVSAEDKSVQNLIQQERQHTFDPHGNLWHATLVELAEESHLLLLTLHPLIADGPSARVLGRDLASLYAAALAGEPATLPDLAVHYADYAAWQRGQLGQEGLQKQLDFWTQNLNGYKALFPIKPSRNGHGPRPLHAYSSTFGLAEVQVSALKALSQHQALPWHLTLAAAFQTLLYRCTNEADIALALPIPHRPHKSTESMVGPFANYLALRTFFTEETRFLDVLQQIRTTFTAGFGNQDAPFEAVARLILPGQIQVMFAVEEPSESLTQPSGLTFTGSSITGSELNFELCMRLQPADAGRLSGRIAYNPHLFDDATIERFVKDYQLLMAGLLNAPERPVSALALADVSN